MALVIEATLNGNVGERLAASLQKVPGYADSNLANVLNGSNAKEPTELALKLANGKLNEFRKRRNFNGLTKVFRHVFNDLQKSSVSRWSRPSVFIESLHAR
jgi:hypothetical protein